MNKILSILVMLIMISSVVLAGGTPGPWESSKSSRMEIVKSSDGVKVFYKCSQIGKVRITIYNQKNDVVFSEEIKSYGFVRPYNLNKLPEGEYRVVLQDEREKREELVSIVKEIAKPLAGIIRANENQVAVTFFSKVQNDITVTFLDGEKNVVFTESYSVKGRDTKLFNLKNVKGAIAIEVADGDGIINGATL